MSSTNPGTTSSARTWSWATTIRCCPMPTISSSTTRPNRTNHHHMPRARRRGRRHRAGRALRVERLTCSCASWWQPIVRTSARVDPPDDDRKSFRTACGPRRLADAHRDHVCGWRTRRLSCWLCDAVQHRPGAVSRLPVDRQPHLRRRVPRRDPRRPRVVRPGPPTRRPVRSRRPRPTRKWTSS